MLPLAHRCQAIFLGQRFYTRMAHCRPLARGRQTDPSA